MSYIVLEQKLIEDFFQFFLLKSDENKIILKLLNHFKPFVIADKQLKEQLEKFLGSDNYLNQRLMISDSGFWKKVKYDKELYTDEYYKEMLEKSKYKILLTTDPNSFEHLGYHKICIQDKATHFYAHELQSGKDRDKAQKHIFSLMKNANKITIIDKFLYKKNIIKNLIKWFNTNELNKNIHIIIQGDKNQREKNINNTKKFYTPSETKTIFTNNQYKNFIYRQISNTIHDRYIIIDDTISINLTSGLENLFNTKKDFTYIISEKQYP